LSKVWFIGAGPGSPTVDDPGRELIGGATSWCGRGAWYTRGARVRRDAEIVESTIPSKGARLYERAVERT
jgi:hypothetical protein